MTTRSNVELKSPPVLDPTVIEPGGQRYLEQCKPLNLSRSWAAPGIAQAK